MVSHAALHASLGVLFGDGFALVVVLLTTAEADFKLRPAIFIYIELERYQGHTLLGELARELSDLLLVEEKLAVP